MSLDEESTTANVAKGAGFRFGTAKKKRKRYTIESSFAVLIDGAIDSYLEEVGKRSRSQLAAIFAKQQASASYSLGAFGYKSAAKNVESGKKSPHKAQRQLQRVSRILAKRHQDKKDMSRFDKKIAAGKEKYGGSVTLTRRGMVNSGRAKDAAKSLKTHILGISRGKTQNKRSGRYE